MGEAARLEVTDIDHDRSVLVVRGSKLENGREVPLHPTALAALAAYAAERHRFPTARPNSSFFISGAGTRLYLRCIDHTFGLLVRAAGLHGRGARGSPRLHDLRHSFAVKTLLTWHRDGIDVDAAMPLLSKILGHASPASTYWYLQAVPELFAVLEDRLGRAFEGLP
jgi:integrase/recombinase XerD